MTGPQQPEADEASPLLEELRGLRRDHLVNLLHSAIVDMIAEGRPEQEVREACARLCARFGISAADFEAQPGRQP